MVVESTQAHPVVQQGDPDKEAVKKKKKQG